MTAAPDPRRGGVVVGVAAALDDGVSGVPGAVELGELTRAAPVAADGAGEGDEPDVQPASTSPASPSESPLANTRVKRRCESPTSATRTL